MFYYSYSEKNRQNFELPRTETDFYAAWFRVVQASHGFLVPRIKAISSRKCVEC